MCGVGKFLKIWGHEKHDKCPLCGEPETAAHVPLCSDEHAQVVWEEQLSHLAEWMESKSTFPPIQDEILNSLRQWHEGTEPSSSAPLSIIEAVANQRRIGTRGLFEGLLSWEWATIQDQHYRSLPRERRSGSRWASLLIEQLWLVGFAMWEHRNDVMHSPESTHAKEEMEAANQRIRAEFDTGSTDPPQTAQCLFQTPLHQRLLHDLSKKEKWLTLVQLERDEACRLNRRRRLQRRNFESYFQRPTRSPEP